jgi:hypothetical protein
MAFLKGLLWMTLERKSMCPLRPIEFCEILPARYRQKFFGKEFLKIR